MGVVKFSHSGSFKNLETFINRMTKIQMRNKLERYGDEGVRALSSATPVDTGATAASWGYEITERNGSYTITWTNSNAPAGVPIAVLIQYGHATRNGGFVQGRDFINPAITPVFDKIADDIWAEVKL